MSETKSNKLFISDSKPLLSNPSFDNPDRAQDSESFKKLSYHLRNNKDKAREMSLPGASKLAETQKRSKERTSFVKSSKQSKRVESQGSVHKEAQTFDFNKHIYEDSSPVDNES